MRILGAGIMSPCPIDQTLKLSDLFYAHSLSPSYLYEIGLLSKTPNWLSQVNRNNVPVAKIRVKKMADRG
jgi:hypothetical protein